jgi:hypothetical protein
MRYGRRYRVHTKNPCRMANFAGSFDYSLTRVAMLRVSPLPGTTWRGKRVGHIDLWPMCPVAGAPALFKRGPDPSVTQSTMPLYWTANVRTLWLAYADLLPAARSRRRLENSLFRP